MANEEVKVVDQPKTEEKLAEEKKIEAPEKAAPKKRGPKAKKPVKKTVAKKKEAVAEVKKDDAPVEKKAPAKRGLRKATKTAAKKQTKAASKTAPEAKFDFAKTMFEYDGKKFTAESINEKVLEYLNKHPYISAEKIETFVNIGEKRIYFTVDGFGNPDFTIDL